MRILVYFLALATNILCSALLLRGYFRVRRKLLLWSGLCFGGLALSSALVFVDLVLIPKTDLFAVRLAVSVAAMSLLVYGLISEEA